MAHIGIDTRLTYYRAGGTSAYIRYLVAALEQIDHDNTYTLLHSRKTRERLAPRLRHVPLWTPAHHRLERLALSAELARWRLDVLHSPDFIPPLRGARRHVITVHDLAFLRWPEHMTAESRRYYNARIKTAVAQADHILAVSASTRHDLMALLDVPSDKITVQYHGVDPRFRPLPRAMCEAVREQLGLPESFILFVGTLEPRKNLFGLLAAYDLLRARLPDAPALLLAGQVGWLADDILAAIRRTPGVQWITSINHDNLPAVLNLAALLTLPAHYEGFGLPALEAMACGTLTVVSDRSALPEVVGEVGLCVNPDDPADIAEGLYQALTAPADWRLSQREAALARAAAFTWERSAQVARAVYEKVVT